MRRWSLPLGTLLLALTVPGSGVKAQEAGAPIIVVVESASPRYSAGSLRRALSEYLDVRAVSLLDAAASSARGTLSIAVEPSGRRASIEFRSRLRPDSAAQVTVEAAERAALDTEWLVSAAVALMQAGEQRTILSEILDPWGLGGARPMRLPSEVLDPFTGTMPERVRLTSTDFSLADEILDPWTALDAGSASGAPSRSRSIRPGPRLLRRPAR
ncbi:MAG: hypothetical protein H5U40_10770 [Polyangiaceae bacterium]|nr:hypothetical protein [Polyangiaceae bacterium]